MTTQPLSLALGHGEAPRNGGVLTPRGICRREGTLMTQETGLAPMKASSEAAPQAAEPNQLALSTRTKKLDSRDMTCAYEGFLGALGASPLRPPWSRHWSGCHGASSIKASTESNARDEIAVPRRRGRGLLKHAQGGEECGHIEQQRRNRHGPSCPALAAGESEKQRGAASASRAPASRRRRLP